MNTLDTIEKLAKLVAFYVAEHNSSMPHSAFQGQTPDEMYAGTGDLIPHQLAAARAEARQKRLDANRATSCGSCPSANPATGPPGEPA